MNMFSIIPIVYLALESQAQEYLTTAKDRSALSVTIYQNDLAAIRDTRRVTLPGGPINLVFRDLLPTLRPKSATLLDPEDGLQVLERNFEFNTLTPSSLVDSSLGERVWIKGEDGQRDRFGTLLSVPLLNPRFRPDAKRLDRILRRPSAFTQPPDSNVIVETLLGIENAAPRDLAFVSVSDGLRSSPTLVQRLNSRVPGARDVALLYTASGLSWLAHYEATLSTDGRFLDLDVFATVKNVSGGEILGTTLQLVAGDPNVVRDPPPVDREAPQVDMTTVSVAATSLAPPVFKEEKLSEYPLFTLDRPVSIKGASEKQLSLMRVSGVPVSSGFLIESPYEDYGLSPSRFMESPLFMEEPLDPGFFGISTEWGTGPEEGRLTESRQMDLEKYWAHRNWLERQHPAVIRWGRFTNSKASRLGRALPKGTLNLRYRDPSGALIVLPGPQSFDSEFPQTPPGHEIELVLGQAKGFFVDRRCISQIEHPENRHFQGKRGENPRRWEYEVAVQIANRRDKAAEIKVREPISTGWKILFATHPSDRTGPHSVDFSVHVPANGRVQLKYSVLTAVEEVPGQPE